jgi:hypothetical protein
MQVVTPRSARRIRPAAMAAVLGDGLVGATLIVTGFTLAFLCFLTPVVRSVQATVRDSTGQLSVAIVAWVIALALPVACLVVGLVRLDSTSKALARFRPRRPLLERFQDRLGDDYFAAADVELPDGRLVPEIVIGPYGVAVLEEAPPPEATRHRAGRWEVRLDESRWAPMENPLERVGRDADRVRRWLAADDRDFVVKVYAALVASEPDLARTPACAVITREQAPAWLTSLPAQRSLSAGRLERVVAQIVGR